jgi:hypothetical protein
MTSQANTDDPAPDPASENGAAPPSNSSDDPKAGEPTKEPLTAEALDLPDGLKDSPLVGDFLKVLNETDPTDKAAMGKSLLELHEKVTEANLESWYNLQAEWRKELENDPNFGGDKLAPGLGNIAKLIDEFATSNGGPEMADQLRLQFDQTGAGNNPAIVKFLIWTASQLSEGRPLSGSPAGGEVSRAQKLFGT